MSRHARHRQPGRSRSRLIGALLLLGLLASSGLTSAQTLDPAVRIAYVDMKRLIDDAPQTLTARERLTREFAARDELLKVQVDRLAQMDARLRNQGSLLGADEFDRLNQETETQRRLVERMRAKLSEDLARRNREEADLAWPEINEAVARYARDHDIDLVLPSPVVYVSARIDITDRVLDLLRSPPADEAL